MGGESDKERSTIDFKKVLYALIDEAAAAGASALHIDPIEDGGRLRHRIFGDLLDVRTLSSLEHEGIAEAINQVGDRGGRILTVEAQEKSFTHTVPNGGHCHVLIATTPVTNHRSLRAAPKITLKLHQKPSESRRMSALGLPTHGANLTEGRIRRALGAKSGLILICGPSMSGRSTTLSALCTELQRLYPNRARLAFEDKGELVLPGVSHVDSRGADSGISPRLRSLLCHDIDEIAVGQISDRDVAQDSIHAVMTGALVVSTVGGRYADDAYALVNALEVDGRDIDRTLIMVIEQRLVRRVCTSCSTTEEWSKLKSGTSKLYGGGDFTLSRGSFQGVDIQSCALPGWDGKVALAKASGCPSCRYTGHSGLALVVNAVTMEQGVAKADGDRNLPTTRGVNDGGRSTLWEHGLELVSSKITSIDEMLMTLGPLRAVSA